MIEADISTKTTMPTALLIGALGGQGGGVLADWIVVAAHHADLYAQSTSVPGVAQRTGATTYYIEVFPVQRGLLNGSKPILALYPCPGEIDIAITTELLEAGRAIEQGYVSADRTALITSTHRDYSIGEKVQSGSNFYDSTAIMAAIEGCTNGKFASDFLALSRANGSVTNAVLLGILCESNLLPIRESDYRKAITEGGIAVDSNLSGFDAGINFVREDATADSTPCDPEPVKATTQLSTYTLPVDFPAHVTGVAATAMERLEEFQSHTYANEYAETIKTVLAADRDAGGESNNFALTSMMVKRLARVMCYNDIIQVARAKCGAARRQRIRTEVGCKPSSLLQITDFLKPGRSEIASILPPGMARAYLRRFPPTAQLKQPGRSLRIKSNTILGFGILRLLAGLRFWRPKTARYCEEAQLRGRWVEAIIKLAASDYNAALEMVECSDLLRGYGKTESEGRSKFASILQEITQTAAITPSAETINSLRDRKIMQEVDS